MCVGGAVDVAVSRSLVTYWHSFSFGLGIFSPRMMCQESSGSSVLAQQSIISQSVSRKRKKTGVGVGRRVCKSVLRHLARSLLYGPLYLWSYCTWLRERLSEKTDFWPVNFSENHRRLCWPGYFKLYPLQLSFFKQGS